MPSILYSYAPDELQYLLDTSNGYGDLLIKVGLSPKGRNAETLKKIINQFNLSEDILKENRSNIYKKCAKKLHEHETYDLQDILDGKHQKYQSAKLLKRLVKANMKEYKCEICGISEWNNKPIKLQLHHTNGDHFDNSLSNLKILCPNCHSQTDTFCGKSSKRKKEKLINLLDTPKKIKEPPISKMNLKEKIRKVPFTSIAKEYGVTDNAVRKWCKKYNLPFQKKVISLLTDEEWDKI